MYTVAVKRDFIANHYLTGGDWGAENEPHAHHYQVEVQLQGEQLDRHGYLVDIVEVEQHLEAVVADVAGRTLNDLAAFAGLNPSIERLATILHGAFRTRFAHLRLQALTVTLWEDEIAWTSYRAPL